MRVFRSTCKGGKILPLWGTYSLRKSKGKRKFKSKHLKPLEKKGGKAK